MSGELDRFFSFFERKLIPEERLRPPLYVRVLMALGGILCLVFGLMTSFNEGLAFITFIYFGREPIKYLPMVFQPHPVVYTLLLACPAGILSLIASIRRRGRAVAALSYWGTTLGLLGSFLFFFERVFIWGERGSIPEAQPWVPGLGFSMTLLGLSLMLAYPVSIGVLPLALTLPLLMSPLLMLTIYLEPPLIIEHLKGLYEFCNLLLHPTLPALIILIRYRTKHLRRHIQPSDVS